MISAASPENLLSWAGQVLVIASAGALLPRLFRIHHPRSHLTYCHIVLLACLVLPFVQPWQYPHVVIGGGGVQGTLEAAATAATGSAPAATSEIPWLRLIAWVFVAGLAARLCWFALGLWQISRYRLSTRLLHPIPESVAAAAHMTRTNARFCVSTAVVGPVTYGFLYPVVLLPESFLTLAGDEQQAIACHELLHVRRRDWLITLVEELAGVLFWFHPAVWWLLAQARLAREQLVDAQVVRLTDARDPYIDALLAMAGAKPSLDLAPAPLFLRRRHLTQRMHSLLSEASMSRFRLFSSYALVAAILAGAGWVALVAFPLTGEAQIQVTGAPVQDPNGITINAGGNVRRTRPVAYPLDAQQKRIEGSVFAELSVNKNGDVTDARVLSGPDELRKAVLQSVLQWQYAADSAPSGTLVVSVEFRLPAANVFTAPWNGRDIVRFPGNGFSYTMPSVAPMPAFTAGFTAVSSGVLTAIDVNDVPEPARTQLAQRLSRFVGQVVSPAALEQIDQLARETIPAGTQRTMRYAVGDNRVDTTLKITTQVNESVAQMPAPGSTIQTPFGPVTPPAVASPFGLESTSAAATATDSSALSAGTTTATRLRVGGTVQASNLIHQVKPEYPQAAREMRIQGMVVLEALIGTDGKVLSLKVVTGHPMLIKSAIDAVQQWVYKPSSVNGQPVEVATTVTVNFAFQQ